MNDTGIQGKAQRQSNIELLRIVSMCMIIAMHYMTKGMKIEKLSVDNSMSNIIFWIIYAFCLSSVNAYVFISGYFAPDSKWSISKVLRLWGEVLVYSVGVSLAMSAFGLFDLKSAGLSVLQQIFMPVTYEHYWFATAYIMMLILAPVLNIAVTKLERRTYGAVLILLLAVFAGLKSVDPYLIPWDKYGNDVMWFVVLYLFAGYVRMYGVPLVKDKTDKKKSSRWWLIYITFSLLTFVIALAYSIIVRNTGKLEYSMDMTYCYNYVTIFVASIGLFMAFAEMNIKTVPWINRIAGCTFGVYLLHDNIAIRNEWQKFLGIGVASGKWWQIFHMLFCIAVVFAAGIAAELVRQYIVSVFIKVLRKK